ncbi:ATP-binding protein [Calothrix sp. UHCC 0171]|uniref:hybrid sensor histidine kinase/response regulator n=1 Tax=Calothrix sp. UHCC 0171 TaxID=3110245 RepID=UPI002B21049E|nr:ATP-binding protein [Calothrix sp. UHCC 0171]MEA5570050.1 ATP-binding protein [Calothrix sp. UHCC 0171]
MVSAVKILLIEDNLAEARFLQELLTRNSTEADTRSQSTAFTLIHVKRLQDGLKELSQYQVTNDKLCPYDAILLDLTLPDSDGLASLSPLIALAPSLPIVVLTNTNDDELAVEAVRQGAQDYLIKRQVSDKVLLRSLRYAIERKQALENLRAVNQNLEIRVEERTAELVKAQEINQFKSEFVSMLSHDIRNPLNTILLAAGLLQNNDHKLSQEKKTSHFQLIRSAVKSMSQLLDEVSFIGQADTGRLAYDLIELDLEKFCSQVAEEAQLAANESKKNLIFTTSGDFCTVALWDEVLLRHILCNLLNNAIKYSPENSTILFDLINQENRVIFQIQDSGIGIEEEDLPYIFQPFHRANNVGKIPGTGLGLAIVKKCVEAHRGEISVWSELDIGTTFTVSLPLILE